MHKFFKTLWWIAFPLVWIQAYLIIWGNISWLPLDKLGPSIYATAVFGVFSGFIAVLTSAMRGDFDLN